MRKNYFRKHWFMAVLLSLTSLVLSSCDEMLDAASDNPSGQQSESPTGGDADLSVYNGSINMPTSDATTFLQNCKIVGIPEEVELNDEKFQITKPGGGYIHTFMLTDNEENVYMLARTHSSISELTINAESTALGLATLHPLFGPLYGDDFTTIVNKLKWSAKYTTYLQEVTDAIKQHKNIFDSSNETLIAALDALYDDVLSDIDIDAFSTLSPIASTRARANTRAPYFHPNIPDAFIYADITSNVLTLQCTGLTPSYYGTVKIATTGETKSYNVTSRPDYGGMDIFKPYDQFDLGDKCPFTFTEEGEYHFSLSRTNLEATFDFYRRLANTILGMIGCDFGDETVTREIASTIANALKDASLTLTGPDDASFRDWFGIAYAATLDYLRRNTSILARNGLFGELRVYAIILGKAWDVYGKIKGIANAAARIAYATAAPKTIDFYLCYFNGVVGDCSGAQLMIVSGNGQKGNSETKLETPLKVRVKPLGGTKLSSSYSVRYEVVSGGGALDSELVSIKSDNTAENYWTLGKSGEQQVRAVVINTITNKEISDPVLFTASLQKEETDNENTSLDDNNENIEDNTDNTEDNNSDDTGGSSMSDVSGISVGSIDNIVAVPYVWTYDSEILAMRPTSYHSSMKGNKYYVGSEVRYRLYFICTPCESWPGYYLAKAGNRINPLTVEHGITAEGLFVNGKPYGEPNTYSNSECIVLTHDEDLYEHIHKEHDIDQYLIYANNSPIPSFPYFYDTMIYQKLPGDPWAYEACLAPGQYNICIYFVVDDKTYYTNTLSISLPNLDLLSKR